MFALIAFITLFPETLLDVVEGVGMMWACQKR